MSNRFSFVLPENAGETLLFAAEELEKFLQLLQFEKDFSVSFVFDNTLQGDSFTITGSGNYIISASCERAMLYGSYSFLRALGI